jgi:hypothetical protein
MGKSEKTRVTCETVISDETASEPVTISGTGTHGEAISEVVAVPVVKQVARPGYMLVATNPFHSLDAQGRPCGSCPIDPEDPRFYNPRTKTLMAPAPSSALHVAAVGSRMIVGGVTRALDAKEGEQNYRTERRAVSWEFTRDVFEIPDTKFYRRMIADGVILDANKPTEPLRQAAKARSQCVVEPRWI